MTDPSLPTPDPVPESAPSPSIVGDLDRLLRGQFTTEEALRSGKMGVSFRSLVLGSLALGAFYGACMGLFSGLSSGGDVHGSWIQVGASAAKVPLLFLLTLLVTFPSLYVVSALSRSRLQTGDTLRLLLSGVTVNLALLASLGPVAAFFTLSTDSYPFMKLLHVGFFVSSGFVGLGFLWRALRVILEPKDVPAKLPLADGPPPPPAAEPDASVRRVFKIWILIFGLVGAQMGWILRPFIGSPGQEFTWIRERGSNILIDLVRTLGDLFS